MTNQTWLDPPSGNLWDTERKEQKCHWWQQRQQKEEAQIRGRAQWITDWGLWEKTLRLTSIPASPCISASFFPASGLPFPMAMVENGCSQFLRLHVFSLSSPWRLVFLNPIAPTRGSEIDWPTWDQVFSAGLFCYTQGDRLVCTNMAAGTQPRENRDTSTMRISL